MMLIWIEALVNLGTNKQYPTPVAIYLRIVYNKTSDEVDCSFPVPMKFTRFLSKVKAKHFHLNMLCQHLYRSRHRKYKKCFQHS